MWLQSKTEVIANYLYYIPVQLSTSSPTEIKATHTTPVHKYVDDLKMDFNDKGTSCTVDVGQ